VAEDFLLAQNVEPWSELPLWLPSTDPEHHGHSRVDIQRAENTRLTTRPLEQTVAAVMDEGLPPRTTRAAAASSPAPVRPSCSRSGARPAEAKAP
jgi:2'-hydroxyisoflavone reductase